MSTIVDLGWRRLRRDRNGRANRGLTLPAAEMLLEERLDGLQRRITGDNERCVARLDHRRMESPQIGDRHRLESRLGPDRGGSVAMSCSIQQPRECLRRHRFGVVPILEQRGDALFPKAVQLGLRERGTQRDVGHQRQRLCQPCHGHVQPHGRGIKGARRSERGAEKLDVIRDLQRVPAAGALIEHRHRQAGEAEFAGRIVAAARTDQQVDLHERDLVRLDQPEPARHWRGWPFESPAVSVPAPAPVQAASTDREVQEAGNSRRPERGLQREKPRAVHRLPSGSTISSTRWPAGSQRTRAACVSAAVNDV